MFRDQQRWKQEPEEAGVRISPTLLLPMPAIAVVAVTSLHIFSVLIGLSPNDLKQEKCCFLLNLYLEYTKTGTFLSGLSSFYIFSVPHYFPVEMLYIPTIIQRPAHRSVTLSHGSGE